MGNLKYIARVFLLATMAWLCACASGHCRGRREVSSTHVFVYRADGSKQCGQDSGLTIDQVAEDLIDIKVFSKRSQTDGKMHMALCGAPTGKIHVYEISETDKATALSRGFTELKDTPAEKKK